MINKRNAFYALCELATKEKWCWKIYCTTCGHIHFRHGFIELIKGNHPDNLNWVISTKRRLPTSSHKDFLYSNKWSLSTQSKLASILSEASLEKIASTTTDSSWLGYLGLGLLHTEQNERIYRTLTKSWIPKILAILTNNASSRYHLQNCLLNEEMTLTWEFLEQIEQDL